jgi:NADH-quinone oxidoreductase subunit I
MGVIKSLIELLRGMNITGKHLGRHAVTIQYPEEKWTMPERSRGVVVLLSDKETGELNCTGCGLCEKACPTGAIDLDAPRGEDKKRVIRKFVVDNTICCFCGLCEEACNFSALKMDTRYEMSVLDKKDLVWDVFKLQEMGKDVDYEDTRKKKNPARVLKPGEKLAEAKSADAKPEAAPANPSDSKPTEEKPAEEPKKPEPPAEGEDKKTESGGETGNG